ncbi:hypothetical protein POM88_024143 [Heracleum sosnowskyi]|uniref:ARM repeat superfamily protein n=1 Tax=Heracleum sosnowskyi TaxID=360622 RepID=A0AAD8I2Q2_9APIA|nr:hypothetical protein POM88_024143 [Heracleum sosnowskyi]
MRDRETFIAVADIIDLNPKYVSFAVDRLSFNIANKMPIFNRYVEEIMGSSNLLEAIKGLDKIINGDPRLADHLKSDVVERLVKILKESDDVFIQRSAAYILSRAKFDTCGSVIREKATPVLVDLMSHHSYIIAIPVVITLTRLVCASPDYVRVILDEGAFKAALEISRITNRGHLLLDELAKFMAVVCRGKLLPSQECLALSILDELLQRRWATYLHIERTCFALSYLSYGRHVGIKQETCKMLTRLTTHSENSVVGPALGVLGNIARWGTVDQIEILAKDSEFLRCLGTSLLGCKPKKFQMEACQIISKIAAQSRTFTQDMHSAGLIDSLNGLLEVDESDLKMEAGCAISVARMHVHQQWRSEDIF